MKLVNNTLKKKYDGNFSDHYFRQYLHFVDSTEKVIDRRQMTSNFFLTINTALIYLVGITFQADSSKENMLLKSFISLVGMIMCFTYWFIVRHYGKLNTAKFEIIHEMEKQLPVALYSYEWEKLCKGRKRIYISFSQIEQIIPIIFGFIFFLLGVLCIIRL